MQSLSESKRLFSVFTQIRQPCIYIKRETIQRLVQRKTRHKTDTIFPTSVHEIALVDIRLKEFFLSSL